jgi:HlyD family secretion protein
MMRRSTAALAVVIVLVALGALAATRARKPKKPPAAAAQSVGVPVAVARVTAGSMSESVPVTGSLRALREADIRPQLAARVQDVQVQEGDTVAAGQVLVTLDRTDAAAQLLQAQAAQSTSEAAVGAAAAQWRAAQQRLSVVQQGARPEERAIARSRVQQAQAALTKAQADLDRREKLYADGAVSREELDTMRTNRDTAQANLQAAQQQLQLLETGARPEELAAARDEAEAARKQMESAQAGVEQATAAVTRAQELLGYTVIRAPIDGVVYERGIEPGEIASPGGDPLLRVADLASVYFEAVVPGRLADQVHTGQPVEVSIRGDGATRARGSVLKVVPVANPSSRDFIARISIPQIPGATRPGMYAEGRIIVSRHEGIPVVPKDAIVERGGKRVVFVLSGDTVQERAVQVGLADPQQAEIVSGLQPGEQVVVEGAALLSSGDKVTIQEGGE